MSTMIAPSAKPPSNWIKRTFSNRIVWIGLAVWVVFSAAIPYLAQGAIPFDQPMMAALPYRARVGIEVFGPIVAFIFIGVAYALTRRRFVDIAALRSIPSRCVKRSACWPTALSSLSVAFSSGASPGPTASDCTWRAACSA
jgi:hypothetical protein